jgi:DNA polymerase elongation subunit (family B)
MSSSIKLINAAELTIVSDQPIIIKRKKIPLKSFRLLDFNIYDESDKHAVTSPNYKDPTDSDISCSDSESDTEHKSPKKDESQFVIQMFGLNETGETVCIYINDYKPFFYIKVGNDWTMQYVYSYLAEIKRKLGKYYENSILEPELVDKEKLYGFSGGKQYNFLKLTFSNTTVMNKVKGMWYEYPENGGERRMKKVFYPSPITNKRIELELYESNIPPLLRYFHITNISPSGWVSLPIKKVRVVEIPTTTCDYEYVCSISQLHPVAKKETAVPYKICSFDIEASSSHGDFPLPKKTYKRLATNIIDTFIIKQSRLTGSSMDEPTAKPILKAAILSAFGFKNSMFSHEIDLVYPKAPLPTKADINTYIARLLKTPIAMIEQKEELVNLLSIENVFEKIKEQRYIEVVGNDDNDGGENDGPDSPNNASASASASASSSYPNKSKSKYGKGVDSLPPKINKKTTIIDIILNDKYERDEKIKILNDTLTNLFPSLEGDKTTFIGSTFMRYGENEPYLNHCVVLGSCDPVDGAVIECVDTEKELLIQWMQIIQRENPDIIIGYNIFGFDYEFMFRRAEENHCEREFLKLSRKMGEICGKKVNDASSSTENGPHHGSEYSIENTKVVLASGEYDLRYPKITGRLQIDLYTYFRRDFNLSSYKLDDVAGQFISDDIVKMICKTDETYGDITELYSKNLMGLHEGDFIHIELSSFTTDYYKDGKKFRVLKIVPNAQLPDANGTYNIIIIEGHEQINNVKYIRWGMAKDDVTPQDIFRLSKGSASDRAIVAKYCIQDCNLVHHLMNKIDVLTGYVEMASICSVPISFLVFRGQGIKLTSYVAKKCMEKNTLMPDLARTGENDGYEGAIVLPPKCAMYMDNPVACVDYSSLYPSSMISQNFSHDSKVWTKEYDLEGNLIEECGEKDRKGNFCYDNLPGHHYIDIEFDIFKYLRNPEKPAGKAEKTKVGTKICRWAQFPDDKKGIMPSILEELLKARSDTRKRIKTEKDPFMQNILDKRQLGYKVTANSLYGQCGAKTSTFFEKDVAASTTATGRMMIIYAKRMIEEVYGNLQYDTKCHGLVQTNAEYVYGDTDSVFFTFNLTDPRTDEKIVGKKALEITIEIAQDAAHLCSQWLKPPMELSYEKTLMPFILLSKKRYVGKLYETDANKGKMKYMGLSIKRRDSCDYLKDTYGGVLDILMEEHDIEKSIHYLNSSLDNLIQGNVPMDKLTITKALRSDYKNPQQIAHKVLADRIAQRDPGNKPKPGDRMRFVHIVNDTKKSLQGEKIETPEFIIENKMKIDYTFYITNQLMKPLQQLFGLALEEIFRIRNKDKCIDTYRKDVVKLQCDFPDLEIFMKKKEKYCSSKIKGLLFDDFLTKIFNEKHGIQMISKFFK